MIKSLGLIGALVLAQSASALTINKSVFNQAGWVDDGNSTTVWTVNSDMELTGGSLSAVGYSGYRDSNSAPGTQFYYVYSIAAGYCSEVALSDLIEFSVHDSVASYASEDCGLVKAANSSWQVLKAVVNVGSTSSTLTISADYGAQGSPVTWWQGTQSGTTPAGTYTQTGGLQTGPGTVSVN